MALMGFSDPNAAAAANARAGLGSLANFLYEQQVTKPAAQAQTAGIQAQTQDTLARLPLIQQQVASQKIQNAVAGRAAAIQNLGLHSGALESIANGGTSQATDIPTAPPSPSAGLESPQVSTGSERSGSSGGSPGSNSSPTLPNTLPPTQAGSPTQGAPLPGKFPPDNNDYLSPLLVHPGLHPFSETPARGATTTPAPVTSPVSVSAPVVPPGTATPAQSGAWKFQDHLLDDIDDLPPGVKPAMLDQWRKQMADQGFNISDQESEGNYRQMQQAAYPNIMRSMLASGKYTILGLNENGTPKLVRTDLLQSGNAGLPPGTYRDWVNGGDIKTAPNAASYSPEKLEETKSGLDQIAEAQKQIQLTKEAIARTPGIVSGGKVGEWAGNAGREIQSDASGITGGRIGTTTPAADQAQLQRFQAGVFLDGLIGLKGIGRMDVPVVEGDKKTIPSAGQPPKAWSDYFDDLSAKLAKKQQAYSEEYAAQLKGAGQPEQTLPNAVDVQAPVNPVGNQTQSSTAVTKAPGTYTKETYKSLAPGTWFQWADGSGWSQKK